MEEGFQMINRDAVLFDLDGTLCDVRSIRHHVTGTVKDFDAFHRASADCPPNQDVVEAARKARADGLGVLIVTGRAEKYRELSSLWLARHGVEFDAMWMRPDGDFRPDYVIKEEILQDIILSGWRPVEAHDDRPPVAEVWERHGIPVTLAPGWEA